MCPAGVLGMEPESSSPAVTGRDKLTRAKSPGEPDREGHECDTNSRHSVI